MADEEIHQIAGAGNWRIPEWFPHLTPSQQDNFKKLHDELIKFNKAINLIGSATVTNADLIHFADSILASEAILQHTAEPTIYDIGSGNGFPGLVLAILAPNRKIVVVERDRRKGEYLKHVKATLQLENVSVLVDSVQSLPENSVDCAVSRGFASITKAILMLRRAFRPDGEYFHIKGDSWSRELGEIPTQLCGFWRPGLLTEYHLPITRTKMALIVTKRVG